MVWVWLWLDFYCRILPAKLTDRFLLPISSRQTTLVRPAPPPATLHHPPTIHHRISHPIPIHTKPWPCRYSPYPIHATTVVKYLHQIYDAVNANLSGIAIDPVNRVRGIFHQRQRPRSAAATMTEARGNGAVIARYVVNCAERTRRNKVLSLN